jgi:hypothetical protein
LTFAVRGALRTQGRDGETRPPAELRNTEQAVIFYISLAAECPFESFAHPPPFDFVGSFDQPSISASGRQPPLQNLLHHLPELAFLSRDGQRFKVLHI